MKLLCVSFTVAAKTFRHMVRNGVSPANVIIRGFATAGNLELESKRVEPNLVSFNAAIQELCRKSSLKEAEAMLEEMSRKGLAPDERTYTSLIIMYCRQLQSSKAYKVLNQMIGRGFSPSVATYNNLLHAYCSVGRTWADKAVGILRDMPQRDAHTYTIIISGFCEINELQKAFQMKEEMVQKGILPHAVTYSSLIRTLCRQGRLPETFDLFQEMLRWSVSPDMITYTRLVNAYCATGEFTKVFHLHNQMLHKGFLPDFVTGFSPSLVTYNALIHGLCFFDRVEEALGILRGMPEMGLSPDSVSYSTVISRFCRIREAGKAYKLMLEMGEKGIWWGLGEDLRESLMDGLSDEDTYSSLMNDYLAEGNLDKAYQLYHEVTKNGYLPVFIAYRVFLNGLIKKARTREAKEDLLLMISDQCLTFPSYIVYDSLIENCSNSEFKSVVGLVEGFSMRGLVSEAARAHDTMVQGNYKPDGAVYNLLIFDHCRYLNVGQAYNMYKEMVHYGFAPHMFSVLALINALYHDGRHNEMHWVIQNTLRSCNLNDSELLKVLNEIDVRKCEINTLQDVLAEIAMDSLLLDGGKCSYAASLPPP